MGLQASLFSKAALSFKEQSDLIQKRCPDLSSSWPRRRIGRVQVSLRASLSRFSGSVVSTRLWVCRRNSFRMYMLFEFQATTEQSPWLLTFYWHQPRRNTTRNWCLYWVYCRQMDRAGANPSPKETRRKNCSFCGCGHANLKTVSRLSCRQPTFS